MADDDQRDIPFDDNGEADSPLAERLRRLNWPRAPDGVRERTWERLRDIVPSSDESPDGERDVDAEDLKAP